MMTTGLSLRKKNENTTLPREVAMTLVHFLGGVTGTCPRTLINEHQFPKPVDIIFS